MTDKFDKKTSYDLVAENILTDMSVTAGAGAGKTTSLKNRYISIVTSGNGYGASDISAITFTKKASLEMKEKITHEIIIRLDKALKSGDSDGIKFYKELKSFLANSDISTIHSFCANVLTEHPHEAGIDPDFVLIDERGKILLEETIIESIQSDLNSSAPLSAELIHSYGFSGTVSIITKLFANPYLTESVFNAYNESNTTADEHKLAYQQAVRDIKIFYYYVKKRYDLKKRSLGALDFNDLEIITNNVLKRSESIRRGYQSRIKFLMVDEFQDTNPIQKEIIYLLSPRNDENSPFLFIVGDPKQSIYRFRNADVEIFSRVKKDIGADKSLFLLNNFRSHKKVLDFINIFFDFYMSEKSGDSETKNEFETGYEPLIHARKEPPEDEELAEKPRVKCLFFDERAIKSAGYTKINHFKEPYVEDIRRFEAKLLADEILKIVNGGGKLIHDETGYRPAKYGDIMILFSALTNIELYTRELKSATIPFSLSSGVPFYEKTCVMDMINFLKVADNPHDDIALAGLLRSPFILISDAALFIISLAKGDSLYGQLLRAVADGEALGKLNEDDSSRLAFAIDMLKRIKLLRDRLTISEMLDYFIDYSGYRFVMSSKPDGEIILNNIKTFIQIAESADDATEASIWKFIKNIELLQKFEAKENTEKEGADKVRIMTIHASKGLQSGIVIVPDVSRPLKHDSGNILLVEGLPLGIKVRVEGELKLIETPEYTAVKDIEAKKNRAEYRRRLYVAATRAQDYLIFSGFIKGGNLPERPDNWMDAFRTIFDINETGDIKNMKTLSREIGFITDTGIKPEQVNCDVEFRRDFKLAENISKTASFIDAFKGNLKAFLPIHTAQAIDTKRLDAIFSRAPQKREMNYNATMLSVFVKCKKRYYYKYIYGIPEYGFLPGDERLQGKGGATTLDPAMIGNVVHKVLEEWSDYSAGYGEHLKKTLDEFNIVATDDERAEICGIIDNFVNGDVIGRLKGADEIMREVSYISYINNRKIISKIDCLYLFEGKWRILDYKTETVADIEKSADKYRSQINIYGLSVGMNLNIDELIGELYFLRPNALYSFGIDVPRVRDEIWNLINEIEAFDDEKFRKYECDRLDCGTCGYRIICKC